MVRTVLAALLAMFSLSSCSTRPTLSPHNADRCSALGKNLLAQGEQFTSRVAAIRNEHVHMRDYDRQMIAALSARREELRSFLYHGDSAAVEVAGCSGQPLAELRSEATAELLQVHRYILTFEKALEEDPPEAFVDAPQPSLY